MSRAAPAAPAGPCCYQGTTTAQLGVMGEKPESSCPTGTELRARGGQEVLQQLHAAQDRQARRAAVRLEGAAARGAPCEAV